MDEKFWIGLILFGAVALFYYSVAMYMLYEWSKSHYGASLKLGTALAAFAAGSIMMLSVAKAAGVIIGELPLYVATFCVVIGIVAAVIGAVRLYCCK